MTEFIEEFEDDDPTDEVLDEAATDDSVAPVQYNITSFGADYDVEGLVNRLNREDILVPPFQRSYVWSQNDASRFIESLLLGLPVPGIFLARDPESKRLLVIDGQQRLKSLQFFINGVFNPSSDADRQKIFKLTKVQDHFEGLTYQTLEDDDRRELNDSIIHATIVKQEYPEQDDTSIYHIFERLNNTGRKLSAQEIRAAIYHGHFINLLKELNQYANWRKIYGRKNSRLKDQELILRFLALFFDNAKYEKPLNEFLNKFASRHRNGSQQFLQDCRNIFYQTIDTVYEAIGSRAFRPVRALHTAVFDSVMVGVADRITNSVNPVDNLKLKMAYEELLTDQDYIITISGGTSDEANVASRLKKTRSQFAEV
jgi:uncharacterized protein with ParB-like and HNH nuclease domain